MAVLTTPLSPGLTNCPSTSSPSLLGAEEKKRLCIIFRKEKKAVSETTIKIASCRAMAVSGSSQETRAVAAAPAPKNTRTKPGVASSSTKRMTAIISQ